MSVLLIDVAYRPPVMLGSGEQTNSKWIRERVHDLPCFRIDNVTAYWAEHRDEGIAHTAPSLLPPFDLMWMETVRPPRIVTDAGTEPMTGYPVRWGGLWERVRHGDGWAVKVACYGHIGAERRPFMFGAVEFRLDDAGQLREHAFGRDYSMKYVFASEFSRDEVATQGIRCLLDLSLQPMRLAVGFMHCKNVSRRERTAPRGERRRAEKSGEPTVKFYELTISPMPRDGGSALSLSGEGATALHICRGHFVTYDERPLFGKHRGTFWKPAHVRGNPAHGIVHKSYAVVPPRAQVAP